MKIVIPAREGSKGLPYKNRKLFNYTADIIPYELREHTYILSDDSDIIQSGRDYGFNITPRSKSISQDETSTKEIMDYFIKYHNCDSSDDIVMLYLTYPQRKWEHVLNALNIMNQRGAKSLLCKKQVCGSPYLMLKEEEGDRGSQLIEHDLYRRQDYPKCFELSHYISIFNASELNNLNNNLYNSDTIFIDMPEDIIDVDTQKDLDKIRWN